MTILKDVHLNISGPISSIELVTLMSKYKQVLRAYIHLEQKRKENKTKQNKQQKQNKTCKQTNKQKIRPMVAFITGAPKTRRDTQKWSEKVNRKPLCFVPSFLNKAEFSTTTI